MGVFPFLSFPSLAFSSATHTNPNLSLKAITHISLDHRLLIDLLVSRNLITLAIILPHLRLRNRAVVELPATDIPVDSRRPQDEDDEYGGVVHGIGGHGPRCRQDEDDADEQGPETSPGVDEGGQGPHVPWSWGEFSEHELAEDGDAVGPVESDGADVEDAGDGGVGTETNQIDDDAPEDGDPDCVDGSASLGVDLCPDAGEWQQAITGERPDGSAKSLLGGY